MYICYIYYYYIHIYLETESMTSKLALTYICKDKYDHKALLSLPLPTNCLNYKTYRNTQVEHRDLFMLAGHSTE